MCQACDERANLLLDGVVHDAALDLLGSVAGIVKDDDDLVPFELNMFDALRGRFRSFVRDFLSDEQVRDLIARMADPTHHHDLPELGRVVSQSVLDAFHQAAGRRLGEEFSEAVQGEVDAVIAEMYARSREALAARVGLPRDAFTVADEASLQTLQRHNLYWIRGNYGRNVRAGIERTTADAIRQGLGRKALARDLRRRFAERFALTDQHWATIASASLGRTRAVAQVRSYELAEITHYEILSAGDARVCPVCQFMDGRVFSVETAVEVVTELEAADSPEDVKRLMPWLRWDEKLGAPYARIGARRVDLPRGGTDSARANRDIERIAPLPGFHGRCRCTTIASVETVRRAE